MPRCIIRVQASRSRGRAERVAQRPAEALGGEVLEDEAGAPAVAGSKGSTVSARPPVLRTIGRRAVAQAVHLVEAAGLEPRRHQEEVGAGLDLVGERRCCSRGGTRPCPGSGAASQLEELLVARLAAAQRHQPHVAPASSAGSVSKQQVETLLAGQARHDADHAARPSLVEADLAQQGRACSSACRRGRRPSSVAEVRVGLRVPLLVVDAVDDAEQRAARGRAAARRGRSRAPASGSRARRCG